MKIFIKTYGKTSWFSHKDPLDVLKGISFEIEKGRSLGIVGINGAGKSTLTKIILGLDFPNKGEVIFNGINIHKKIEKNIIKIFDKIYKLFFKIKFSSKSPL